MESIDKPCPNCLNTFTRLTKNQIFCSHKCSDAYRHRAKRRLKLAKDNEEYHRLWQSYYRFHKPIDGYPEKECPGCGIIFRPVTCTQQYCCKLCGDRVRRKDPVRQAIYRKTQEKYSSSSARHFINRLLNKKSRSNLDIDYVMGIYDSQKGKCALSGVEMTHLSGRGRVPTNISIDRIDSSKGYEEGNIQLVCCAVNLAKSNWKQDDFIEMCRRVAAHADSNPRNNTKSNLRVLSRSKNAGRKEDSRKKRSPRNKKNWGR